MLNKKTGEGLVSDFYIFYILSLVGWLYEMSLFIFYGNLANIYNRGFLRGPYLPIYGFGGLLIVKVLRPIVARMGEGRWLKKILISFLVIIILTTGLELLASYILDYFKLDKLWDYSNFSYNFQGRISLRHSIRFGLGGLVLTYLVLPFFQGLLLRLDPGRKKILALILFLIMGLDFFTRVF